MDEGRQRKNRQSSRGRKLLLLVLMLFSLFSGCAKEEEPPVESKPEEPQPVTEQR